MADTSTDTEKTGAEKAEPVLNAPKKDYCAPMHTAEHVLNRTMDNAFGCGRSYSAHIEAKKSKCDYRFSADSVPTAEQLAGIAEKVNQVLAQNLPVTAEIVSREAAAKECDLSKLPADASEMLRLVRVGDYDVCPCIGKHVENTSECGAFTLLSHEYKDGTLRLRWKVSGPAN